MSGHLPFKQTVLLFNYDILTQMVLFEKLKGNYNIIASTNLKEVKPILEQRNIHFTISDINENDFEYWRSVKQLNANHKLIAITPFNLEVPILGELGIADQLTKPIDLKELDKKLKSLQ
jgi:response regulator RpfG family c-di-GMP phosphodiesterase